MSCDAAQEVDVDVAPLDDSSISSLPLNTGSPRPSSSAGAESAPASQLVSQPDEDQALPEISHKRCTTVDWLLAGPRFDSSLRSSLQGASRASEFWPHLWLA